MQIRRRRDAILAALFVGAALSGCAGASKPSPAPRPAKPCPVTSPGGELPRASRGFNYGNGRLAVVLWPKGNLVAGALPDGSSYAEINPDGSIEAKLGWWRSAPGRLAITGKRLDGPAPALRAAVPSGYGSRGFQASGVTFPTPGCWRVVGSAGRARLTFVVRVRAR